MEAEFLRPIKPKVAVGGESMVGCITVYRHRICGLVCQPSRDSRSTSMPTLRVVVNHEHANANLVESTLQRCQYS